MVPLAAGLSPFADIAAAIRINSRSGGGTMR